MVKETEGYNIGDKVHHQCDLAPFIVTGLTTTGIRVYGDWSGGASESGPDESWVRYVDIIPYEECYCKVVECIRGEYEEFDVKDYPSHRYLDEVFRLFRIWRYNNFEVNKSNYKNLIKGFTILSKKK